MGSGLSNREWVCCSLFAPIDHSSPENLITRHLIYQVGVLAARGPVGRLDQRLLQPTIALPRLGAQPFASADLGLRTESCPTDHVPLAGELVELDAQFRYDDLGNALVDPRDLIQDAYHLSLAACWVR